MNVHEYSPIEREVEFVINTLQTHLQSANGAMPIIREREQNGKISMKLRGMQYIISFHHLNSAIRTNDEVIVDSNSLHPFTKRILQLIPLTHNCNHHSPS